MDKHTVAIQSFYSSEAECVSSPFTYSGEFDADLMDGVLGRLGVSLKDKDVLDVGCGLGLLRSYAMDRGSRAYFGVDLVPSWRSSAANGFRNFLVSDALSLPFRDHRFDVLFCIDSFEHFPTPSQAATEFRRVLRPGGTVVLSTPNYANVAGLLKRYYEGFGRYQPDTWAPFGGWKPQALENFVTPSYVQRVFAQAGFRKFRSCGLGREVLVGLFPWVWHPRFPGRLANVLMRALNPVGEAITRLAPHLSLHVFWAIS